MGAMIRYLALRVVGLAAVLICVSAITFALMHLVPGGPFDGAEMPLPAGAREAAAREYGLDQPLPVQYLRYLGSALHGDLGHPFQSPGETVLQVIARAWPVTLQLVLMSLAVAAAGGVLLGTVAAYRPRDIWGITASIAGFGGLAVPSFVLAVALLLTAGRWLPAGGWSGPTTWALPVLATSLAPLGIITRYTRACVQDVLREDFVRTGRAKGLGPWQLALHHVLRNAAIPLLTAGSEIAISLFTATVFVESIFRVPGLGGFYVTSVLKRDYPMIMGLTLLAALVVTAIHLATDLLYVGAEPRVRLGKGAQA